MIDCLTFFFFLFYSVGEDFDDVDDDENIEELDQPEVKLCISVTGLSQISYFY